MLAAVDLGSNSFRLHVARLDGNTIKVIRSARDPLRLAAGLDKEGNLSDEAMQKAIACLARFRDILNEYPIEQLRVVATNTIRVAKNAATLLPKAEAAIGCQIEVISGEEEGRLIYLGVANSAVNPAERRLVVDIGGGSTEIILGWGHEIVKVESFSMGTVPHSSAFFTDGKMTEAAFSAAILSARSMLEDAAPDYQAGQWRKAYGSSGTIRAISEAILKGGLGDGSLTMANLQALQNHCIQVGEITKLELSGIKPERIAMVVGGLAILIGVMAELRIDQMVPVEAGLRVGVMWDLHLREHQRDRREQAVQKMAELFHIDSSRGKRVGDLVRSLYLQLKPASENYLRLLQWSASLHEVGMIVSHTGYHKHGAYLLEHADMAGFTNREQKIMSRLILSQKGNLRKLGELIDLDFAKAVLALRLAVMLMHSRADLDYDDLRIKMKSRIELDISKAWVDLHPTIAYWLEKEIACWGEVGIIFSVKTNA